MNVEEIEIIKRAKNGYTSDIANIINNNIQSMYRVAFSILKNEDQMLDAISNTVVIVFEKISTLKYEEYFKTWLTKILINECYKILKHNKKVLYFENADLENSSYTDKYEDVDVKRVISKLDKDLKQLVLLYYFEDFSVKEISEILKIPAGTVKSRLYRAREVLKNELLETENYVEGGELNG